MPQAKLPQTNVSPKVSRRKFLAGLLASMGGLASCAVGSVVYPWRIEPHWLQVTRLSVAMPGLPLSLNGLIIAQLSDLHCGPNVPIEDIRDAVGMTNRLQPDIVALTGDFVSGSAAHAVTCAAELKALRARYGVWACLGNHDHWTNPARVAQALEDEGIAVLRNEAQALTENAHGLWIAGVDDIWEKQQDLDRTMSNVPSDVPTILLAHEPDFADEAARHPASILLQLSGHSHGGQIRLPFVGALIVPPYAMRYPMGFYRVKKMALYTNRGIGLIRPAVRFNCRPEVTLITLRTGT